MPGSEVKYEQPSSPTGMPALVSHINQLQPGDILLFRIALEELNTHGFLERIKQLSIAASGALSTTQHGHYDTTHAGLCVEAPNAGNMQQSMMAHLTGHEIMGYKLEPLQDMITRDGGDRAFLVFRAKSEEVRKSIAETGLDPTNEAIKWRRRKVPGLYLQSSRLSDVRESKVEKEIDKSSFCSKFVVQVIKNGVRRLGNDYADFDLNIKSDATTPKDLEGNLYVNDNYELLIYPGKNNVYSRVKSAISEALEKNPQIRVEPVVKIYEFLRNNLDQDMSLNDLEKAAVFLKVVLKNLRACHFDKEAQALEDYIRPFGIFKRDLDNCKIPNTLPIGVAKSNNLNLTRQNLGASVPTTEDIGYIKSSLATALDVLITKKESAFNSYFATFKSVLPGGRNWELEKNRLGIAKSLKERLIGVTELNDIKSLIKDALKYNVMNSLENNKETNFGKLHTILMSKLSGIDREEIENYINQKKALVQGVSSLQISNKVA